MAEVGLLLRGLRHASSLDSGLFRSLGFGVLFYLRGDTLLRRMQIRWDSTRLCFGFVPASPTRWGFLVHGSFSFSVVGCSPLRIGSCLHFFGFVFVICHVPLLLLLSCTLLKCLFFVVCDVHRFAGKLSHGYPSRRAAARGSSGGARQGPHEGPFLRAGRADVQLPSGEGPGTCRQNECGS